LIVALKYSVVDQISKINKLQNEAKIHFQEIRSCLGEADELTCQLEHKYGRDFVYRLQAFQLTHKAIGLGQIGNRDWLEINTKIKII